MGAAQAQAPIQNHDGTVQIGSYQLPATTGCLDGVTCEYPVAIPIGTQWTDVAVFLQKVLVVPTTNSSGTGLARLHVEIRKDSYDPSNGMLFVTERATVDNADGGNVEFQVWFSYIAGKEIVPGTRALALTNVSTSCSGYTDFGCSTNSAKSNVKPSNYEFVGFAPTSIDISTTTGEPAKNIGSVLASSTKGSISGTSVVHSIDCGILSDITLPMDCTINAVAIASYFSNSAPLVRDILNSASVANTESFDVTNTLSSTYSRTVQVLGGPSGSEVGAFSYLESFNFYRDGDFGGALFAPVEALTASCGPVTAPYDAGTPPQDAVDAGYEGLFKDRVASPWAWYNADIACKTVFLNY